MSSLDPKIKALLEPYAAKLHKFVNEVVGYADGDLDMEACTSGECELGNFIADAFLNAVSFFYIIKLLGMMETRMLSHILISRRF